MTSKPTNRPISHIVAAGEGRTLQAGPTRPVVKVGPHCGSRRIGILESELPPGGGFPGHSHDGYEEAFYVLDGSIDYLLDGAWVTAAAGSTIFVPPGREHGFRNTTTRPARHLAISSPAEAMTMIEELTLTTPERWPTVMSHYGTHLSDAPHQARP
jgi:quercetin dioxygenase-like cupin family protein